MLKLGLKSKVSRLEPENADGKVMEWRYDDRNMVTKALYDGEEVLDQVHDDAYRLTNQTFGQDLERVITFGRQDNLRTNDHVKDGSQIIDELDFDYTYAADKNVISETNPSGLLADLSFGVTYDDGNRVKTWNRVADYLNARGSQTWNYDDAGNWNATIIDGDLQNRTNNGSDELTSIEGNALTYDSRGNLLEDQDGQKYTWDIDNRIATIEPSDGSDTITHQYDAFSRRVHREFGNTDEVLLWWGKEEYAEHENIGSQPTIQNDLHAHPTGLNTTFGRALEGSKHDIQYFHKNYLDHVYAVSDDRGDIIEHYRYTAFGEPEFYNESGEQLGGSAIDNDILWNVKRYSEASGLYMYLYRHYEAEHGRWPSRDPIAERGGVNLYGFVRNIPLDSIDILGLIKITSLKHSRFDSKFNERSRSAFVALFTTEFAGFTTSRSGFSAPRLSKKQQNGVWGIEYNQQWSSNRGVVKGYLSARATAIEKKVAAKATMDHEPNSQFYQSRPDAGFKKPTAKRSNPFHTMVIDFIDVKPEGKESLLITQVKDRVENIAGYAYDQDVCYLTISADGQTYPSSKGVISILGLTDKDEHTADIGTGE